LKLASSAGGAFYTEQALCQHLIFEPFLTSPQRARKPSGQLLLLPHLAKTLTKSISYDSLRSGAHYRGGFAAVNLFVATFMYRK
ncbi:hypothetical protein, partial [Atopomonas hussainii]|uniref:hypothetical protein n=1 Tax=Atopomonas hussainii TaxID=1429083 RepID=UPI001C3183D4